MTTTMPKCIVDYCRNYAGMRNNIANVMLHGFPTTVDRIKTWLRSINRSGHVCENLDDMAVKIHQGKKHDSYRVCSEHFSKSCYLVCGEKRMLKKDAVPTIFTKEGELASCVTKQCSKNRRSLMGKQAKKYVKRLSTEYSQQSSPEAKYIYKENSQTVNDGDKITQLILNLTLEIIHLLTGEDYIVVKKSCDSVTPSSCPRVPGTHSPITEPPPHSLIHERDNDQKILELTNKIIQLLTGEEWEYIEGHRDLYKDVMINELETLKSVGDSQNRIKSHSWISCTNCANMNTSVDRNYQQSKCFQIVNQRKKLKKLVSNITKELDFYEERNLTEQMDYTTCIKEEPLSCREENFIDIDIDLKKYSSTHMKEESVSCDRGDLTDSDNYTPKYHTQYKVIHIKEEPISCDGGDLTETDNYTPTDHAQYTSTHSKEGAVSCDRGDLTDTDMCTPTYHAQYTSTHVKEEPVSCDGGDLTDTDMYTPTGHTQYIFTHSKEEPVSCDGGDLTHTDVYTPTGHTQYTSIHIKEEPVSCDGEDLTHMDNYTPTDNTQYTATHIKKDGCDGGDLTDTDNSTPTDHTRYKSTDIKEEPMSSGDFVYTYLSFRCSECSECFPCKSDLIYHQTLHRREKLRCSECGKYFSNKSNLSNHIRGHTGEKPYTCLTCGKCFTRKSTLVIHQRIHTGEKPFVCLECGRSFNGKGNLRKHQKVHRTTKPATVKTVMPLPLALLVDSNIAPYQML
ncbi:oocyte zinc finger protein XlCOF29-like isoform X2 [Pseudophryne corroboree]|uniref:oocyte zinc finger protein XlCOF29-like isoform X2 n=1 Tax=Pseudophryne corroboree TaxID=495146 RepID=UPI00308139D5